MATYLKWFALKADKQLVKLSSIGGEAIGAVPLDAHLMAGSDALSGGQAGPVAIFFVFDSLEGLEFCTIYSYNSETPARFHSAANRLADCSNR